MKPVLIIALCAVALSATAASANCVAEYKAKMDNPLRLQAGSLVVDVAGCDPAGVESAVRDALAEQGWTLLSIQSITASG